MREPRHSSGSTPFGALFIPVAASRGYPTASRPSAFSDQESKSLHLHRPVGFVQRKRVFNYVGIELDAVHAAMASAGSLRRVTPLHSSRVTRPLPVERPPDLVSVATSRFQIASPVGPRGDPPSP
jgi:hypothetical protein